MLSILSIAPSLALVFLTRKFVLFFWLWRSCVLMPFSIRLSRYFLILHLQKRQFVSCNSLRKALRMHTKKTEKRMQFYENWERWQLKKKAGKPSTVMKIEYSVSEFNKTENCFFFLFWYLQQTTKHDQHRDEISFIGKHKLLWSFHFFFRLFSLILSYIHSVIQGCLAFWKKNLSTISARVQASLDIVTFFPIANNATIFYIELFHSLTSRCSVLTELRCSMQKISLLNHPPTAYSSPFILFNSQQWHDVVAAVDESECAIALWRTKYFCMANDQTTRKYLSRNSTALKR